MDASLRWRHREVMRLDTAADYESGHAWVSACADALSGAVGERVRICDFETVQTSDGRTAAFVACALEGVAGRSTQAARYGAGVNVNPATAAADALVCALNRLQWDRARADEPAAA
jgi:hypothetical protein